MKSKIAVDALAMLVARRGDRGRLHRALRPADRTIPARSFLAALRRHHLAGSMGQVTSADDSAAMESYFTLLQKNVLNRRR